MSRFRLCQTSILLSQAATNPGCNRTNINVGLSYSWSHSLIRLSCHSARLVEVESIRQSQTPACNRTEPLVDYSKSMSTWLSQHQRSLSRRHQAISLAAFLVQFYFLSALTVQKHTQPPTLGQMERGVFHNNRWRNTRLPSLAWMSKSLWPGCCAWLEGTSDLEVSSPFVSLWGSIPFSSAYSLLDWKAQLTWNKTRNLRVTVLLPAVKLCCILHVTLDVSRFSILPCG
jgi:hypothetical protein